MRPANAAFTAWLACSTPSTEMDSMAASASSGETSSAIRTSPSAWMRRRSPAARAASAASGACPDCEAPLAGYGLGVMGGLVGLGAGAAIGGAAGRDVVVSLDVKTAAERTAGLRKLRRYARVASPL